MRTLPDTFVPRGAFGSTTNLDRKSTRLNSSHLVISYAVFCLKKKKTREEAVLTACELHPHEAGSPARFNCPIPGSTYIAHPIRFVNVVPPRHSTATPSIHSLS